MDGSLIPMCVDEVNRAYASGYPMFAAARPPFDPVDREKKEKREKKQNNANRGGLSGAKVVQLNDDLQRRDLRLARDVSGDEDDRTIFAERAGEGQGHAAEPGGKISGKIRAAKSSTVGAKTNAACSFSVSHSRSTG